MDIQGRPRTINDPLRKHFEDLRFLMENMVAAVQAKGKFVEPTVATIGDIDIMFNAIADDFHGVRDAQKQWTTVVNELRDKIADDNWEANGLEQLNKRRWRTT
ncbi:hypothetical protein ACA910_004643 [Epithemia clementina (nom. ined.)]